MKNTASRLFTITKQDSSIGMIDFYLGMLRRV